MSTPSAHRQAVEFHGGLASSWDDRYLKKSFIDRERSVAATLEPLDLAGTRWLDAGCGTGRLARLLVERGAEVVSLDGSAEMLELARGHESRSQGGSGLYVRGDVTALPFRDQSFDGVLCVSVIEYVTDPAVPLRDFRRILRDDGIVVFSQANRNSVLRRVLRIAHGLTGRPRWMAHSRSQATRRELAALTGSSGFAVDDIVTFGGPRVPGAAGRSRRTGTLHLVRAGAGRNRSEQRPRERSDHRGFRA